MRPGDTLAVEITVQEKTPSETRADRGYVDFKVSTKVDRDEDVMSVVSHNIVRR